MAANETDPDSGNNSATEGTSVGAETDLSIAKADSVDPVPAGAALTYTVTVTNAGPSPSTGSTVTDVLPSGVTFSTSSDCTEAAGTVTCVVGTLAPGASDSVAFTVTVDAGQTAALSNTATVTANETDPDSGNNSATEGTAVGAEADLSITKDDGVAVAVPGKSVTYTIVAANAGPSDVTGALVEDTFPAELTCTWTCTASGGASCAASGTGDISETVDLPVSGAVTFSADCAVAPTATGTLSNTATVSSTVTDPDPGNDAATDVDSLGGLADLQVSSLVMPNPVELGGEVVIEVSIFNAGPSEAEAVTLTTVLPSGLILDSTQGCVEDPTGVATCSVGNLAADSIAQVVINTRATASGTSEGSLEVGSDTVDPDDSNDLDFPSVTVGLAVEIPALDVFGLAGLALLLSLAGWTMIRRRSS
ncbi:MAG: DUF11 domain-containing protein [Acidobacteriota bacterium]